MFVLNTPLGFIAPHIKGNFLNLGMTPDVSKAVRFEFWSAADCVGSFLQSAQYIESYVVLSDKSD